MFIGLDPTSCRIGAQYSQNHELVRSNFNIAILARFATVSSNSMDPFCLTDAFQTDNRN